MVRSNVLVGQQPCVYCVVTYNVTLWLSYAPPPQTNTRFFHFYSFAGIKKQPEESLIAFLWLTTIEEVITITKQDLAMN